MNINEISTRLKECGVVGCGGAGFPSYGKLSDKAETIVLNCAECEPLFRVHRQLLADFTFEIFSALQEIKNAVDARNVIIAIKPSYTEAIEAMESIINNFSGFSIRYLTKAYPAGDEIITIHEVTTKIIEPGKLPITKGVILYNVETMLNAYHAIFENKPVTHKFLTITGAVKKPTTVKLPIGTSFKEALKYADGASISDFVYLNGGIMTGSIGSGNDLVTKTTNAIIILPKEHPVVYKKTISVKNDIKRAMSACCQCQSCTDLCSRHLMGYPIKPHMVMRAVAKGMDSDIKTCLEAFTCSSCGLCEMYSCPQDLSPRNIIADLKKNLRMAGITPPKEQAFTGVSHERRYKRIPEKRLIARVGVEQYDKDAPMDYTEYDIKRVQIKIAQGIGALPIVCVKVGDKVKIGDVLAGASEKLGVSIHSSIDGKVSSINGNIIMITKEG